MGSDATSAAETQNREEDQPEFGALDRGNDAELENRQRKFGMMMKPFQI